MKSKKMTCIMNLQLQDRYKLYINGEWKDASDGATIKVYNPSNGELLSEIADASNSDVDRAIASAREAFQTWGKTTPAATVESMDNGKPIRETAGADIPLASDHFRYFAGVIRAE